MTTRAGRRTGVRNLAAITLLGHAGGAALLGAVCLVAVWPLATWGAFAGGALGGAAGAAIGLVVLVDARPLGGVAEEPPLRPWLAVLAGTLASMLVTLVSVWVEFFRTGFLDGSPCQELSGGRGPHTGTVQTLVPLQYTCLFPDSTLLLVPPTMLAALSILALAGAAAIVWGMWRLRGPAQRPATVLVVLAAAVALYLAVDGVLGVVALLAPAGTAS